MASTSLPMILATLLISLVLTAAETSSQPPRSAKHFVLVHGSCHGAWSWYKLVPLLKSSGHNVTTLDLAASGVHPQQVSTLRLISEYFRPLWTFMASLPEHERVVLVGHSSGGLAISQAMEHFSSKVSVAVFLTALMPGPSLNISAVNQEMSKRRESVMDSRYTFDNGPNRPPTTFLFGPLFLLSKIYQLSPAQDWTLATTLMRPVRLFSEDDMSKELTLSAQKYSSVKRVYVISKEDEVWKQDFQQWMTEKNPPSEVRTISGSDHMVMMSKPKQLCGHLLDIAQKYAT